jgi:large subunit ribosomal protein L20
MARAKRGFKARRRRNRIRQAAKGYRGGRSKLWKAMVDAVHHAWRYATWHRRLRKRDFRQLWIVRINAAARNHGMSYSKLVGGLKRANVELDRKILAELAISDPAAFAKIVERAKSA